MFASFTILIPINSISEMKKYEFYLWPALIGLFNAISEASNQGKITHFLPAWFGPDSWQNKYTWFWGYGKYWPLIVFTDAFHFFKTCWVVCMCWGMQKAYKEPDFYGPISAVLCFVFYSAAFEIVYTLVCKL